MTSYIYPVMDMFIYANSQTSQPVSTLLNNTHGKISMLLIKYIDSVSSKTTQLMKVSVVSVVSVEREFN